MTQADKYNDDGDFMVGKVIVAKPIELDKLDANILKPCKKCGEYQATMGELTKEAIYHHARSDALRNALSECLSFLAGVGVQTDKEGEERQELLRKYGKLTKEI